MEPYQRETLLSWREALDASLGQLLGASSAQEPALANQVCEVLGRIASVVNELANKWRISVMEV